MLPLFPSLILPRNVALSLLVQIGYHHTTKITEQSIVINVDFPTRSPVDNSVPQRQKVVGILIEEIQHTFFQFFVSNIENVDISLQTGTYM